MAFIRGRGLFKARVYSQNANYVSAASVLVYIYCIGVYFRTGVYLRHGFIQNMTHSPRPWRLRQVIISVSTFDQGNMVIRVLQTSTGMRNVSCSA